ncbi:Endoplasmic reticulum oxidoreductin-1 [Escovopsis weberi]|uniref:Endoplasmic reticulum oxidoreductin-1 n=1 Tax=Escovopsis weberi TaxID=150374 RepID=A0A0M9VVW2_ESCWE|nr:Endoplasmic reticulum oxidoreductin-1 [Escovopsis weberi]
MKPGSRVFSLAALALWASSVTCSEHESARDSCSFSSKSIVDDACVTYGDLDKLNARVKPAIDDLVQTADFFSHYRVNLYNKKCPFWDDENGICGNIACAVETLENEEDIPLAWRASELSKLEGPRAQHPGRREQKEHPDKPLQGRLGDEVGESCVVEYDDEGDEDGAERDYCVPEDESAGSRGDYVSLLRNPERFTGYSGQGAWQVWDAIYRENCFSKSSFSKHADLGRSLWPPASGPAALDFKHVLEDAGRQAQLEHQRQLNPNVPFVANTGLELDDECLEKRVFYRVISGMHASISAHLCWDFLNQSTGQWQPNPACYEARLRRHPDRVSNLYFNYALVTRAIAKLQPYILGPQYTFCAGDTSEDAATRAKVLRVTRAANSVPQIFDESLMFVNGEGPSLKEDFRSRFRNVSRLMDCVGCDKCRLWGKVQTNGYGTALKVLFEFSDDNHDAAPVLTRTEVVALFNTYARLGESLKSVARFEEMLDARDKGAREQEREQVESAAKKPESSLPAQHSQKPQQYDEYEEYEEEEEQAAGARQVFEDDDDMREFIRLRSGRSQADGLAGSFALEMERFQLAIKIVINSWLRMPKMIWTIVSDETHRLYRFWVGLPARPRRYEFRLPNLYRDEL